MVSFDNFPRVHRKLVDAADKSVENAIEIRKQPSGVNVKGKLLLEIAAVIDSKNKEADDVSNVASLVVAGQSTV